MPARVKRFARAARVGLLPVSLHQHATMISASAISAGLDAATANPVPVVDLTEIRKCVFMAGCRSRFRIAQEEFFTHFFPWRGDLIAMAVVKLWEYIRGAVARGVPSLAALSDL